MLQLCVAMVLIPDSSTHTEPGACIESRSSSSEIILLANVPGVHSTREERSVVSGSSTVSR